MSGIARSEIATATDGCGVVSFGMPISGLALAFARLADPGGIEDAALRGAFERIRDAMMAHPELVGGDRRRFDTELMRTRPGRLVSKAGAEGVKAVGVLRRATAALGLALKVRVAILPTVPATSPMSAALARLGVLDAEWLAPRRTRGSPDRQPAGRHSGRGSRGPEPKPARLHCWHPQEEQEYR